VVICCNASRGSVNAGLYEGIQFNLCGAAAGLKGRDVDDIPPLFAYPNRKKQEARPEGQK
jgi:hypothetical protein